VENRLVSSSPDLCIIGAGALGVELALHARRLGGSVVLVDRGMPEPGDSTAIYMRRAAIRQSAARVEQMRRAPELGIGASEFKLTMKQVSERAQRLAEERGRATSADILRARGVTLVEGPPKFSDARTILAGDLAISARGVIVAIGGEANVPAVPGLAETAYFTIDTIIENQRKLTHLVIIGNDAAAIEEAQVQRRLGAEVTLVPGGEILEGFDREAVALLLRELAAEGVRVLDGWSVGSIKSRSQGIGVEIRRGEDAEALDASHILISAGRSADLEALDYAKASGRSGRNPLGGTGGSRIGLAGAAGGHAGWAASRAAGLALVEAALGTRRGRALVIPHVVETEPGLAELRDGKAAGNGDTLLRENLAENDQAAAMGITCGLVKAWVRPDGRLARTSIVAPHAAEMAGVLALATQKGGGLAALASLPLPRPSLLGILSQLGENHIASPDVLSFGRSQWGLARLLRRRQRG